MKTLMTAALLAGLALAGIGNASEPTKQPDAGAVKQQAAVKKLTNDDLRVILENMGYELKPALDNNNKQVGFNFSMERSGTTIYGSIGVSANGEWVWIQGTLAYTADAGTPAEALLAMLAENHNITPASINYSPQTKKFGVSLVIPNSGVTPAVIRSSLDKFATGIVQALNTWDKALAKAKQAKGTPAPSPLP